VIDFFNALFVHYSNFFRALHNDGILYGVQYTVVIITGATLRLVRLVVAMRLHEGLEHAFAKAHQPTRRNLNITLNSPLSRISCLPQ